MKFAGIIAEYDPFHNGHAWQLAQAKALGAERVAVAMSCSLVQRGALPLLPEAVRTRSALTCGADLVFALPAPCACAGAEAFARAGVALLAADAGPIVGAESGPFASGIFDFEAMLDFDFKTRDIESYTLIEHRYFGRLSMGAVYGKGPNEVGQHIHNELEQWYYALPGAKFTYHVNDEEIPFNEGDLSYTPHGNYHGTSAEDGQRFDYIWFELCENGYPGQLK